eukprot:scaffold26301_cov52-Attheya_sp.AAC.3
MPSYHTLFLFLSIISRTDAAFVVGRTHLDNTASSSTYTHRSVWRRSASNSPNADPNNSDNNHNVNNESVETEKEQIEWGVQKPGMPDNMKERIQLLAEQKKNERTTISSTPMIGGPEKPTIVRAIIPTNGLPACRGLS